MEASSFSGLLTRIEIGHIRSASEANGRRGGEVRVAKMREPIEARPQLDSPASAPSAPPIPP